MKKISFAITLIFGVLCGGVRCQETPRIDKIFISQFDILPKGAKASGPNILLLDSMQFFHRFGKPWSIHYEIAESSDFRGVASRYLYNGAEVWYESNHFLNIKVTNSNYVFRKSDGSSTIKVGDKPQNLCKLFPNSWASKKGEHVFVKVINAENKKVALLMFDINSIGIISSISYP